MCVGERGGMDLMESEERSDGLEQIALGNASGMRGSGVEGSGVEGS